MRKHSGKRQGSRPPGYWGERRGSWHPGAPQPAARLAELWQRRLSVAATLLLLCALLPPAHAQSSDFGEVHSGQLLWRTGSGYQPATRINTDVAIDVSGIIARVRVRQQFRNDGRAWSEGIYVFPLPDTAAVDGMRLEAGERVIEGEIREKAEAKKTYEQAKRAGKRASLVGQQRANLFTTAVANIAPGATVTIEIEYQQAVNYDDGTFSLRVPMTFTPRYIPGNPLPDRQGSGWSPDTDRVSDASLLTPPVVTQSDDHRVTLRADIDAGMPLEIIASRYHPVDVSAKGHSYAVSLASNDEVMDHDVELVWRAFAASVPRALLFAEAQRDEPHLLLLLMPPSAVDRQLPVPPRDLTFVIDTSGSMHGTSLEQAKRAVILALEGLQPHDHFNLLEFNSVTRSLYPHSVPASADAVRQAKKWVADLSANGGTEMRPALLQALRAPAAEGLRQVVFVTDGSVGNEAELFKLISSELGDTRLFTVGIGSAPNGWFMRKAAETGRGTFVTISALHEVQDKMSQLLSRLREPVITDIELEWPDGLGQASYPQRVADLYRGEPVVVRARLTQPPRAGDLLRVTGNAPGGPWAVDVPLARDGQHAGVAALWARARIETLLDRARQTGTPDAARATVTATALRYGLVSRYTSLVAVDKTPVRPADAELASQQVPSLLPYGQSLGAITGFPATATNAPLLRLSGALCILLATFWLFYRVWTGAGTRRALAG